MLCSQAKKHNTLWKLNKVPFIIQFITNWMLIHWKLHTYTHTHLTHHRNGLAASNTSTETNHLAREIMRISYETKLQIPYFIHPFSNEIANGKYLLLSIFGRDLNSSKWNLPVIVHRKWMRMFVLMCPIVMSNHPVLWLMLVLL